MKIFVKTHKVCLLWPVGVYSEGAARSWLKLTKKPLGMKEIPTKTIKIYIFIIPGPQRKLE